MTRIVRCHDTKRDRVHFYEEDRLTTLCGMANGDFIHCNKDVDCETCRDVEKHMRWEQGLIRETYAGASS